MFNAKEYKKKYYQKNRQRHIDRAKLRYKNNRELICQQVRERSVASYFKGLSKEEALQKYKQLIENQNNLCALCNRPETKVDKRINKVRALAIDHCHITGKVRGLLCFECNTALGKIERNLDRLLTYLGVK